jgi:hypothetical protein
LTTLGTERRLSSPTAPEETPIMDQPKPMQAQIKIDIDAKEAEGIYSNLAFLHLSPSEFILDFARIMPGPPRAKVHSRIVLTPQAAKSVLRLLEHNVKKYEQQHGEIKLAAQSPSHNPIGFQTNDPSAPPTD